MKLVIDASVSLKWILGAEDGERDISNAEAVLAALCDGRAEAIQPPHWFAEVLGVIALKRPEKVDETFGVLQAVPSRPARAAKCSGGRRSFPSSSGAISSIRCITPQPLRITPCS